MANEKEVLMDGMELSNEVLDTVVGGVSIYDRLDAQDRAAYDAIQNTLKTASSDAALDKAREQLRAFQRQMNDKYMRRM